MRLKANQISLYQITQFYPSQDHSTGGVGRLRVKHPRQGLWGSADLEGAR